MSIWCDKVNYQAFNILVTTWNNREICFICNFLLNLALVIFIYFLLKKFLNESIRRIEYDALLVQHSSRAVTKGAQPGNKIIQFFTIVVILIAMIFYNIFNYFYAILKTLSYRTMHNIFTINYLYYIRKIL